MATSQLNEFLYGIGEAVSYASKGETIYPEEFMGTGIIPDCSGLENSYLLKDGDCIRMEIDQIGFVENIVRKQSNE
ncbi:fumarylacetoacetate hydrolase family protein [Acetobacterium tundrae]|uniref:fumarylacetoacetate hydrolase family protein n=1 Tax=Acetobacterium tundrae TaxID=132932 RepID=UPI00164BBE33